MDCDPVAPPLAGWLGFSPRRQWRLLGFFGYLVTVRYAFLIIHAVDKMQAESTAASYSAGHEQLMGYYMASTLGLLAMLLPVMLADSPRLMLMAAMAINFLLLLLFYVHICLIEQQFSGPESNR